MAGDKIKLVVFFFVLGLFEVFTVQGLGYWGSECQLQPWGLYRDLVYFGFMSGSGFRGLFGVFRGLQCFGVGVKV